MTTDSETAAEVSASRSSRLRKLVVENPVEASGLAALVVWLDTLALQSSLFTSSMLPAAVTANVTTIALTTSLLTAMAAAVCIYILITRLDPEQSAGIQPSKTTSKRTLMSATWLAVVMAICVVISGTELIASGGSSHMSTLWLVVQIVKSSAILAFAHLVWRSTTYVPPVGVKA